MKYTRLLITIFIWGFLGALFAVTVYRAANQSITPDEARAFQEYIQAAPTPARIFTRQYESQNHVLQTLLAFVSTRMFGVSELTLRLPTLLGGLLYLVGLYRLSTLLFRWRWSILLAVGLGGLNPLILDHLALARGYGLALGLFTWSLYMTVGYQRGDTRWHVLPCAGICLALSVAANLTFAIPALALAGLFLITSPEPMKQYWIPGLLAGCALLALPISSMRRSELYYGAPTLKYSLTRLVYQSFFHHERGSLVPWSLSDDHRIIWQACLAILVALVFVCFAGIMARDALGLAGRVLLLSLALLIAAHWFAGLLYPYDRTGLYLIFLFSMACAAAMDWLLHRRGRWRVAAVPFGIVLSAIVLWYGLEFQIAYYLEWPGIADVKRELQMIQEPHSPGARPVRIGGDGEFACPVNFYRDLWRWEWLEARRADSAFVQGYDYYLLEPGQEEHLKQLRVRILLDTGRSMLAVPSAVQIPAR